MNVEQLKEWLNKKKDKKMKKNILSSLACLAIASSLSATQFYVDDKGQVFTTSAPDRAPLEVKENTVLSKAKNL